MYIEQKVTLNNNQYFVGISVKYERNNLGIEVLKLTDFKNNYYDGGTLSLLINQIEKNYTYQKAEYYDNKIVFMRDVLYIYDRIPILSGIKDVDLNKDKLPCCICYISRDEIINYIHDENIVMKKKDNFMLNDQNTWYF